MAVKIRTGADPEFRAVAGGQSVCTLRLATNESWNDKNGQKQERTDAHHCDYERPLDVRWLCRRCHRAFHVAEGSKDQP